MLKDLFGAFRGGIMQGKVVIVLSKTFDLSVTHPVHLEKIKENIQWAPDHNEFEHAVGFLAGFVPTIQKTNPSALGEVQKYVNRTQRLYTEGLAKERIPALVLNRAVCDSFGVEVEVPPNWWLERSEIPIARCSAYIDVAGPGFGDELRATFTVRTDDFIGWLLLSGDSIGGSSAESEAIRQGLLYWARRFDEDDDSSTRAPKSVHSLLRTSLVRIMDECVGFFTCHECDEVFERLDRSQQNKVKEGQWTRWLDVWKCGNGHTIYMKQDGVKLIKSTG